ITDDTPKFYAELMERCWHPDPTERPTASQIENFLYRYLKDSKYNNENIKLAEFRRKLRRIGNNDQNKTKKDLFLKTHQDSAIVNLCISAALVARGKKLI
ncbi:977_t:CDS:1, partial [Entrophospora sp. SA101]